jgi:DNA-binding transcriptional LysR family regulator
MATKLSFEVLEVLDAIDRTGTFADAAELLHRVPSTLTGPIRHFVGGAYHEV